MEILTFQEIKKLKSIELKNKILETRKNIFDLKFQQATRKSVKTHLFKQNRKMLARLLTFETQLKS